MLCCAWSPDGRHLAAGGEDDLVALYSVADREVLAWGEAHGSWVSALAFDPWCAASSASWSRGGKDVKGDDLEFMVGLGQLQCCQVCMRSQGCGHHHCCQYERITVWAIKVIGRT